MGNQVVHFEIPVNDVARARTFYQNVFDWNVSRAGEFDYWLIDTGEGAGVDGALAPKADPSQPVVNYVHVDSIADTVQKAELLGGNIVAERQEVPGRGAFCVIRDPEGNALGLWETLS